MIRGDIKEILIGGLIKLSRVKDKYRSWCEKYINCENVSEADVQKILQTLAEHLIDTQCTRDVVKCFPQILLYLLYEAIPLDFCNNSILTPEAIETKHKINCVVLGNIVTVHPDALSFAQQYFVTNPSPFAKKEFEPLTEGIPAKRPRANELSDIFVSDLDVVDCSYTFLKVMNEFVRSKWNWSEFIRQFLGHEDDLVRWVCCQCLAISTGMSEHRLDRLLNRIVPKTREQCTIDYMNYRQSQCATLSVDSDDFGVGTTDGTSGIFEHLNSVSSHVVAVSGILLPVLDKKSIQASDLVPVESTQRNLKKIALAVASSKAVCIQGPVGSGKTALVEYLASVTGRELGDRFIKVQLGDQTDSKMLLGSYRCTDVPGEFVWQPGVLTQAVMHGYWILLEDIDSSSMDVVTVVASLLENNALSVPGYRDAVRAAPGFQLFVTQRLLPSVSGYRKQSSHSSSLLEKKLMSVNVEPLTPAELVDIVRTSFKDLRTIAARIVDVYLLFSSGMHYGDDGNSANVADVTGSESDRAAEIDSAIPCRSAFATGRLISTRDLIKFCTRAIVDFDVTSSDSALKVFQDAIDIFCCSSGSPDTRLKLACKIARKLGIVETKAEYFCVQYKPSVSLSHERTSSLFKAGRVALRRSDAASSTDATRFSFTRPSACLLERIACCVKYSEPVLLVGETGVGKTSAIQYLANSLGQKLIVINMNQQSDSADLLGGFKPVDVKFVVLPVRNEFERLFRKYFDVQKNVNFLEHISTCFNAGKFGSLLALMKYSQSAAVKRLSAAAAASSNGKGRTKRRSGDPARSEEGGRADDRATLNAWLDLGAKLDRLAVQLKVQNTLAFAFIEGGLVRAIEKGHWVLLDEINLATAETLECLSGLLEGVRGSLSLLERGDKAPIRRHENFTLFACMNPATDVGKKDLPAGLRNRFTELFVEELTDRTDLHLLVDSYLRGLTLPRNKIDNVVNFYLKVRRRAEVGLNDGTGHKPHYSLRTLCRALSVATRNQCGSVQRSLYEAFCLSFLTQLDAPSHAEVESMIQKAVIGSPKDVAAVLKQPIPEPRNSNDACVQFEGYWVTRGALEPETVEDYILTASVRKNLKDLARIVSIGRHPVLLQGDTSVGKTSLITYLAKASGNRCVRINNHEHTDLQEYVGSYVADESGKLVFKEGVLVEAMRKGHWIILDELNLAPSDVLEALNRVLDDNRELFIAETQETVKANRNFMLFATQNPPGLYGGRKVLSRAFRNRFVELHFDEIPSPELETILHRRCEIPHSYCRKMIAVMNDLQLRRRGSAAFAGKQGFITLRDLFRWGERYRLANVEAAETSLYDWERHVADEGYLILAGRVRKLEERVEIASVLKKHFKRDVDEHELFTLNEHTSRVTRHILQSVERNSRTLFPHVVWTLNMRKLAVMVSKALEFNEPVLLVGSTGGGKTTVCQLIAETCGQKLYTVNCHMHTESSDFVGGLRPVRCRKSETDCRLFEWVDGPLVQAMLGGGLFLADEISLADDSVIERLNSLLEPERTILLAEKGADVSSENVVVASDRFNFVSTMNPGGDFGKKELSPALRNRFTEIWCDSTLIRDDTIAIVEHNVTKGFSFGNQEDGTTGVGKCMFDFIEFFKGTEVGRRFTVSVRDVLTWTNFMNKCVENGCELDIAEAYVHGACLTFLDSFGSGATCHETDSNLKTFRETCVAFLRGQLEKFSAHCSGRDDDEPAFEATDSVVGIRPFYVPRGAHASPADGRVDFCFGTPTVRHNATRLLRALQLNKAILLEGSPGVGKTSLVTALGRASGHRVLRINLSDQTDVSDLFGADLPVEGGRGGEFSWRDGPFLRALKRGEWILLDELNLASQSVLEGLNACLDHRGEVYVPELDKTFSVEAGTRIFACQNPLGQGGSRKGLPQSFLNRFTQVFVAPLTERDLESIAAESYGSIPGDVLNKMLRFNRRIVTETAEKRSFGHRGGPWEFNLRDVQRWCDGSLRLMRERECDTESPDFDGSDDADKIIRYWTDKFSVQVDERKIREAKSREVRRLLASTSYERDSDFEEEEEGASDDEAGRALPETVVRSDPNGEGASDANVGGDRVGGGDAAGMPNASRETSPTTYRNIKPGQLVRLIYGDRMRTREDKQKVVEIYGEVFGEQMLEELPQVEPSFYVTPSCLYVGDITYDRRRGADAETNESEARVSDVNVNVLRQNQRGGLVLRSQLAALKSLLLCVKFNWMAILVGGPSSGKSSVVQTLATLTGNELKTLSVNSAMDTTDILGGFEQTDYNRHLEEIAGKIELAVLAVAQQCLVASHGTDTAVELLGRWENYKDLCRSLTAERTASEETDYFREKLTELKSVLASLKLASRVNVPERDSMLARLESLSAAVDRENSLNSGGKFEWVDSVLIKCLQNGSWLLVDNVNMCSPAVLDRLNALLEPNGVLTIGERGVDENGEMTEIRPHPDFRLFLAMDPRNGEISRAMRNRGVEIYVANDPSDDDDFRNDLKSILYEAGLKETRFQNVVVDLHRTLSEMIIGDRPGTAQAAQAGFVLSQQLTRGADLFAAIVSTVSDVYVRNYCFREGCDAAATVSDRVSERSKRGDGTTVGANADSRDLTLATLDLQSDSGYEQLRQSAAVLATCLRALAKPHVRVEHGGGSIMARRLRSCGTPRDRRDDAAGGVDVEKIVAYLVVHLFHTSPVERYAMTSVYLENALNRMSGGRRGGDPSAACELSRIVSAMSSNAAAARRKCAPPPSSGERHRLPLDLRWLPETIDRFYRQRSRIELTANPLVLLAYFVAATHAQDGTTPTASASSSRRKGDKRRRYTVREYSELVAQKKISARTVENALVENFAPLIDTFDEFLTRILLLDRTVIRDEDFVELVSTLMWRHRLRRQGRLNLLEYGKNNKMVVDVGSIATLTIHFGWFKKRTLPKLVKIVRANRQCDEHYQPFEAVLRDVDASLMDVSSPIKKIGKNFLKCHGRPPPHSDVAEVLARQKYRRIVDEIGAGGADGGRGRRERTVAFLGTDAGRAVRAALIDVGASAGGPTSERLDPLGDELTAGIENATPAPGAPDVGLHPVREHVAMLSVIYSRKYLHADGAADRGPDDDPDAVAHAANTLGSVATVPVDLAALFRAYVAEPDGTHAKRVVRNRLSGAIARALVDSTALHGDDERRLSFQHPLLIDAVLKHAINVNSPEILATTSLGAHAEKTSRLSELNDILWRNGLALASNRYDYVYNEMQSALNGYMSFLDSLMTALESKNRTKITRASVLSITYACINDIFERFVNYENNEATKNQCKTLCVSLEKCNHLVKKLLRLEATLAKRTEANRTDGGGDRGGAGGGGVGGGGGEVEGGGDVDDDDDRDSVHLSYKILYVGANVTVITSYMKAILASEMPPIDPVHKRALKLKYCAEERAEFETMSDVYETQSSLLSSADGAVRHPFRALFAGAVERLRDAGRTLERHVAVRPEDGVFDELVKDVTSDATLIDDAVDTIVPSLNAEIERLSNGPSKQDRGRDDAALNRSTNWTFSQRRFCAKLASKYLAWYPDLVEPVLDAFAELAHGVDRLSCLLNKLLRQDELRRKLDSRTAAADVDDLLVRLVQFPTGELDADVGESAISLATRILGDDEVVSRRENLRLLKCSLQDMWNGFTVRRRIASRGEWERFERTVERIVAMWRRQEDETSRRKQEEESLYRNRPRCETKSDEEVIDEEVREMFPDLHGDDFADIVAGADGFDRPRGERRPEPGGDDDGGVAAAAPCEPIVGPDDVEYVAKIHSATTRYYAEAEWLRENRNAPKRNATLPLVQKYNTFGLIFGEVIEALDYRLDARLLPSLNVVVSCARFVGEAQTKFEGVSIVSGPSKAKQPRCDFYTDPNVDEVKTCLRVIEPLGNRVTELLNEWPNHPTLESIDTIVRRVLGFAISSPVFRFLTGVELLLTKCNEWEENAHSGVSLATHVQELARQVIAWRKLELSVWRNCLDYAVDKAHKKAARWWFHVYGIMEQYVRGRSGTMRTRELIATVQQFVERSSLGEFGARLDMLYAFHCHALFLERSRRTDKFRNVMWNLHCYYKQFRAGVENRIKAERGPIEKQIKDFVKIVRWNDIGYWSVKETVTKTHRTLHKHVRRFEDVLGRPVAECLTDVKSRGDDKERVGVWDRPQRHSPSTHHYVVEPNGYVSSLKLKRFLSSESGDATVSNDERLFVKSRNLSKKIIVATSYSKLVQTLDSFVTSVVETGDILQSHEIDESAPREKQKSQAKNILQRKRKALSDLFKNLQRLGLSYRAGIVESKIRNGAVADFLTDPIDLSASFSYLKSKKCDGHLLTVWDGCETYYQRSVARFAALSAAVRNPSPDLGATNVERFVGFSAHLMTTAQKQKLRAIECTGDLYRLRCCLSHATDMFEDDDSYFPLGDDLRKNADVSDGIHALIVRILNFLEQLKTYVLACPDAPALGEDVRDVPVLSPKLTRCFVSNKDDERYGDVAMNIQYVVDVTSKLSLYLEKSENVVPSTDDGGGFVFRKHLTDESFIELNSELEDVSTFLRYILNVFVADDTAFRPICRHIHALLRDIKEKRAEIELLSDKVFDFKVKSEERAAKRDAFAPSARLRSFEARVDRLSTKLLLAIQGVYKKYCATGDAAATGAAASDAGDDDDREVANEEEVDEFSLRDDHLKTEILESLYDDLARFDVRKVVKEFRSIVTEYKGVATDFDEMMWCQSRIKKCFPLIEQTTLLYQYFIVHQISTYRITCKLSSILFGIFVEMSSKGFCVPPELSDESAQDGRQGSQSGTGLGDGEGEKDVSDRIESEDQLDEAKRREEYENEKEESRCDEEKGGIEMSEDFEGQLQDPEKGTDDESDRSDDDDSDAEKQMGDTERDADKLDQQIWGDDKEEKSDDEDEHSDTDGEGGDGDADDENAAGNEKEANRKTADGDALGAKNENRDEEENRSDEETSRRNEPSERKDPVDDINEMNEPEYDDDHVDPYHGKHEQRPEPEAFDLPDDLQLDDGEQKQGEDEANEENPFDIDKMKEQRPADVDEAAEQEPERADDNEDGGEDDDAPPDSDGDEANEKKGTVEDVCEDESDPPRDDERKADEEKKIADDDDDETKGADAPDEDVGEGADDRPSGEDRIEATEVDARDASIDNARPVADQQNFSKPNENFDDARGSEDEGVGQAESERNDEGHSGDVKVASDKMKTDRDNDGERRESKRRIGEADSKRSLGDVAEPVSKKLKSTDTADADAEDESAEANGAERTVGETCRHVEEATEFDPQIMDAATDEQAEKQRVPNVHEDEAADDVDGSDVDVAVDDAEPEANESDRPDEITPERRQTDAKRTRNERSADARGENVQEATDVKMDVEGDVVDTVTVMRGKETTYHTRFDNVDDNSDESRLNVQLSLLQLDEMRKVLEDRLGNWQEPPPNREAERVWDMFSSLTSNLARDLAERLRLVLEPTETSHLRGDYRTGRRINMRKVIPYVASQFRKDKIWLRRTKPSKRDYQIVLAIDDSQSMADNRSKELAFESLALISSALTLLEAGRLSVLGFGEDTEVLHRLTDRFTERSGSRLLQRFTFDQKKTCVAKLVDFTCRMFETSAVGGAGSSANAKLLIVVSDGRGVFSEGEVTIRQAVRRARFRNVFMVFVIVDNPENKDSVLDIRMPTFEDGKLSGIKSYLDDFPFPFYLILRDIDRLPDVLSDALRQWFELVSDGGV